MISLEQIQALHDKVQNALDVIVTLREENDTLRAKLGGYEKRVEELEVQLNSFSKDQDDIESGILNILQQLDKLEGDFSSESSDTEGIIPEQTEYDSSEIRPDKAEKAQLEPETAEESVINVNSRDNELVIENETNIEENPPVNVPAADQQKTAAVTQPAESESSFQPDTEKTEPEAELDIF